MVIQRQISIAEQVASLLHQRIVEGVYAPGERLPSESGFAEELGVSRGTVRSALATLATADLIMRRQGDGTYVRQVEASRHSLMHAIWGFTHLIEASGRKPMIQAVSIDKRRATEEEATALDIGLDEDVISVVRVFYADKRPIIFSTNLSPATLFAIGIDELDATIGIHRFLKRYCNREVARIDTDISATVANEQVQEALSLEPNTPVLRMEQIFRDFHRHPLVFALNYHCDEKLSIHDVWSSYSWGRTR